MASSFVAIANSALTKLGAQIITDLTEDSKEARLCSARIYEVRDIVLRMHPWNFATKRVILAPVTENPAFGYNFQFNLPDDWLRTLQVYPESEDYKMEGGKILANVDTIELVYTYRVANPALIDSLCAEVIACYLAYDISYALIQTGQVQEQLYSLYQEKLRQAKSIDAKEDPARELEANLFLESRYIYPGGGLRSQNTINTGA
jgi:hypothetical protein